MAKDVADVLGAAIGKVVREAATSISTNNDKHSASNIAERVGDALSDRMKNVSGSKGLAAGVGMATVVPLAAKGVKKVVSGIGGDGDGGNPVKKAGEKFGEGAKDAATSAIPGKGGKSKGVPGVGKGRRMPIQQAIDIGAPIDTVWETWTEYEEWPKFMHRLDNVSQEDDEHIAFKTKIWGISKQFRAEIVENEEGQRIKWKVTDGVTHTGVVTFHELGPRLTRVEVNIDVQPGSLIEKAARGMRHVKRAVRADLARFKAYVLMQADDGSSGESRAASSSRSESSQSSSSGGGGSSGSGSGRKSASARSSSSQSSSSGRKSSSSSGRKSSSSGGGSSSSARKSSSNGGGSSASGRKSSSSGSGSSSSGRKSSGGTRASSNGSGSSSSGRKSSSQTRASSNGRSSNGRSSSSRTRGSSSNGRSRGSARKRTASRS